MGITDSTNPLASAGVRVLGGMISGATGETARQADRALKQLQLLADLRWTISSQIAQADSIMVAWADASPGSRPDGGSTGGVLVALAHKDILEGRDAPVVPLYWQTTRLPRVSRSASAAETQAAALAEDLLTFARASWHEIQTGQAVSKTFPVDAAAHGIDGALVTDSKTVFDSCQGSCLSVYRKLTLPTTSCILVHGPRALGTYT